MQIDGEMTGRKKILVVSPTPSHPQNAGNRSRIYRMLKNLKEMGHEIHFLNANREYAASHVKTSIDPKAMIRDWDKVFYPPVFSFELPAFLDIKINIPFWKLKQPFYPILGNLWRLRMPYYFLKSAPSRIIRSISPALYESIRPIYRRLLNKDRRFVSQVPDDTQHIRKRMIEILKGTGSSSLDNNDGGVFQIDEWYNFKLDKFVQRLHRKHKYDVVLCEYVFMSQVLNNFGKDVLKIIDTHDVFANRNEKYANKGLKETFFSTTVYEEGRGLNRADKIIAIQNEEKRYFQSLVDKDVVTIGHTVYLKRPELASETNKNILYIGTGNIANVRGIEKFIAQVLPLIRNEIADAKLILAGHIGKHIDDHEDVIKLGEVKELSDAYKHASIVINPGEVGTGLKIKNIEALGFGKILVTSSHSAEGLKSTPKTPFIVSDTAQETANAIINVMNNVDIYNDICLRAYEFAKEYNKRHFGSLQKLFGRGRKTQSVNVTDIGSLQKKKLQCIIFTFPRTGSTTLRKLFDLHPQLSSVHEPFSADLDDVRYFSENRYQPEDIDSTERVEFILDNIFKNHNCIKHLEYQLTPELNKVLLKYPNCKVIFLWRKNLLQRRISNYISTKAQYWHNNTNVILRKKFDPISVENLHRGVQRDLEEVNKWRDYLKAHVTQYTEIAYEDLYALHLTPEQKLEKLHQLFAFLGVERLENKRLIGKAMNLLDPQKTKLNSELTYKLIPNIQIVENSVGCAETGYLFSK